MFQFFKMLLGNNFPQIGNECNKNMNWIPYFWHKNWEENIPRFYFCIWAPTFSTRMPSPLKICFTNKVNTICGGGQLIVTGSQGPGCQDHMSQIHKSQGPGSQIQSPRVLSLRVTGPRVLGLRVPDLTVLILRYQGPGFCVSSPDFRLCQEILMSFP